MLIRWLQVATNPEIDLGDDDNPDQVDIMLRVMYDDDTVYGLNRDFEDPNLTKTFLEYYVLGDKYDVPVVRQQAKDFFISELQGHVHLHVEQGAWRSDFFDDLAKGIAVVLGPSAITFGDRSIQEETIEWCARNLDHLLWHRTFRKLLSKGQMFSTEFAGKLLLIKARFEHVEFGWDLDPNDVYDDSSSDEDITQLESESEAEQDNNDDEEDDDEQEDDEERNNDDEESSNDDEESDDDDGIQVREYEVEEELGSNARL
jgi:hypothetical protein